MGDSLEWLLLSLVDSVGEPLSLIEVVELVPLRVDSVEVSLSLRL